MFDKQYYETGNYEDYLQRKFDELCGDLISELKISKSSHILDFGCAYGGLLNEFFGRGYKNITGTDISIWAIEHGKRKYPKLKNRLSHYNLELLTKNYDYILLLDVLEHIEEYLIDGMIDLLKRNNKNTTIIARIPISISEGNRFFLDVSNNDKTHITCHCRDWWLSYLSDRGLEFIRDFQTKTIYSSEGVLAGIWKIK